MIEPDLASLILILRPEAPHEQTKTPPRWWGRAAHAMLLNIVRQYNPQFAEHLHQDHQQRPFSVSTLMGKTKGGIPLLSEQYRLRITAYQKELAAILIQAAQDGPLSVERTIDLDYQPFKIEAIKPITDGSSAIGGNPWAALNSYQQLSAPWLLAKDTPNRRISIQFTSATTFKRDGKHLPIPLPELVFGSLLERWNEFAPITFPEEVRRYTSECMALGRFNLHSYAVHLKAGSVRIGAVGQATYSSLNYDRYWMSVVHVLANFSLFSGVGAGTSMGLGQCRMVSKP